MKIRMKDKAYHEAAAVPVPPHKKPTAQWWLFRRLLQVLSFFELRAVRFSCRKIGMERLPKKTPCLVLMNHSSFIDLKIAATLLADSSYHIICTSDGFIGKEWLMRRLGCIPTRKFQTDVMLLKDMAYAVRKLHSSLLMYPEASYSFDGTATPLPDSLGKCLKFLKVPVVMIRTYGAFSRDPLYNNLRKRRVSVSADMEYLLSPEEIEAYSVPQLNDILKQQFSFDGFAWQQQNRVRVAEPFRAEHLNRVLYKCPHCLTEGKMKGAGDTLSCTACGKTYRLTEWGELEAVEGETRFSHVPDWYAWQRDEVRREIRDGRYRMEVPVTIAMMRDMKCLYRVGTGTLVHTNEGFRLEGCDGALTVVQKPSASYSVYSDFYWYQIADVICIGDTDTLYYCFLPSDTDLAAKARLAAEELWKEQANR